MISSNSDAEPPAQVLQQQHWESTIHFPCEKYSWMLPCDAAQLNSVELEDGRRTVGQEMKLAGFWLLLSSLCRTRAVSAA